MALTRKEKLLKAMLEDNAAGCLGGVTREERMLAGVAKKACDNDVLEGGGSGGSGGEKTFIFTQRNASDGQITYSANMTYEDLKAALKSENPPLCIARMITFGETSGGETVPCAYFSMITEISLNLSLNSIKLTVNNGAEYAFNSDGSIYLMN